MYAGRGGPGPGLWSLESGVWERGGETLDWRRVGSPPPWLWAVRGRRYLGGGDYLREEGAVLVSGKQYARMYE